MLTGVVAPGSPVVLAHTGEPTAPHDLWTAWVADPIVLIALLAVGAVYATGIRRAVRAPATWRQAAMWTGLGAVAIALLSPLDALAGSLAAAHMAQHVLLVLVAAPALALAQPGAVLLRGAPSQVRRATARVRARTGLGTPVTRRAWGPAVAWLGYVMVLWLWHARVLYEAALRNDVVHALEHATMLGAALLLWGVVCGAHGARRIDHGQALLLVFAAGLQGVLLSALLTFAGSPWYAYGEGPALWGLTPLADQQLAGVVLWGSGTAAHLLAALVLLGAWFRAADAAGPPVQAAGGGIAQRASRSSSPSSPTKSRSSSP